MDEHTKQNLRKNQFKAKGTSYYTGGHWLLSEQRERFLGLKTQIMQKCSILERKEKDIAAKLSEIGVLGLGIQNLVRGHNVGKTKNEMVSVKKVFAKCFNKSANRIYEAIAFHRATKAGLPMELPKTTLIKFGEALGNKKFHNSFEERITENGVSLESGYKKFKDLTPRDVVEMLGDMKRPASQTADDYFLVILNHLKKAKEEAISLKEFISVTEDSISKNQMLIKAGEIRDEMEELEKELTAIESEGPNSVSSEADINDDWNQESQSIGMVNLKPPYLIVP